MLWVARKNTITYTRRAITIAKSSRLWSSGSGCNALLASLIAVIVNSTIQHVCHLILDWESAHHRYPSMKRQIRWRLKRNAGRKSGDGVDERHRPDLLVAMHLAYGTGISTCHREGAQVTRFRILALVQRIAF